MHGSPDIAKRVMLSGGQVPAVTQFAQATLPPGASVGPHQHTDIAEVFLVEHGRGRLVVEGREVALSPGSCVTVEPGETHAVENHGDEPLVLTYFGVLATLPARSPAPA